MTKTKPWTSSRGQPKTGIAKDRNIRAKQEGAAETQRQQKAEEGDPMPRTGTSGVEQAAGAAAPRTGSSGDNGGQTPRTGSSGADQEAGAAAP